MAKVKHTRLYRIESIYGDGLYCSNKQIGSRMGLEVIRDVDLYNCGRLKNIRYRTHGGEERCHNTMTGMIGRMPSLMSIYGELPETVKQLSLDLDTVPPSLMDPGPFANYMRSVLNVDPIFQAEFPHPEPIEVLGGGREERRMIRYPNGDEVYITPWEQLKLDIRHEDKIVSTKLYKQGNMTIADLIEMEHYKETCAYRFADADDNRPMPNRDGIEVPQHKISGDYLFAFSSLERMSEWLDGAFPKDILNVGAVIKIIDVREAHIGKCQAIYRPRDVMKSFTVCHTGQYNLRGKPKARDAAYRY
uniref:Uncharacterized protein n=1 Tax=Pseudomonas phage RVTF4 TaxID=3236931 RepID=A0AB39CCD9_9VIRU